MCRTGRAGSKLEARVDVTGLGHSHTRGRPASVDQTAICNSVIEDGGSWIYTFEYQPIDNNLTVEKGSITVNGVSLTVVNSKENQFSVCIIPYTKEHTTFNLLKEGDKINLEFDIIGKYVAKMMVNS